MLGGRDQQVDAAHVDTVVVDLPEDRTALTVASKARHLVLRAQRARSINKRAFRVPDRFGCYLVTDQKDATVTVAAGVRVHVQVSLGAGTQATGLIFPVRFYPDTGAFASPA